MGYMNDLKTEFLQVLYEGTAPQQLEEADLREAARVWGWVEEKLMRSYRYGLAKGLPVAIRDALRQESRSSQGTYRRRGGAQQAYRTQQAPRQQAAQAQPIEPPEDAYTDVPF